MTVVALLVLLALVTVLWIAAEKFLKGPMLTVARVVLAVLAVALGLKALGLWDMLLGLKVPRLD